MAEIMSVDVESVSPGTPIAAAREMMRRKRFHHLVVKKNGDILGIVSARDLGHRYSAGTVSPRTVSDVMSRHVLTIDGGATVNRASYKMRGHSVGCLVVLARGRLAGIVTTSDLLGLLSQDSNTRRSRAGTTTAIHHRVGHRHRARGDGTW